MIPRRYLADLGLFIVIALAVLFVFFIFTLMP